MKLTRSNIAHDLSISPHRVTIPYEGNGEITYIFSSALYAEKFTEKRDGKRAQIELSLYNRFGFRIDARALADLRCYMEIEKRGFRLEKDGKTVVCADNLKLDGGNLTLTSFAE